MVSQDQRVPLVREEPLERRVRLDLAAPAAAAWGLLDSTARTASPGLPVRLVHRDRSAHRAPPGRLGVLLGLLGRLELTARMAQRALLGLLV